MSKEKQIEEMAKALTAYEKKLCERLPKDKCLLASAVHAQVSCDYCKIAEFLVNAGYRKQSDGEWIVTDADSGSFGEYEPFIEFKCPKCESTYGIESGQYDWQYGEPIPWVSCPLCGAKMKGGE